jgi:signal transduction histidine kinase
VSLGRRRLYVYGAVVALYVLVFGWWLYFFANQEQFLVKRLARRGLELAPGTEEALRTVTRDSMRMFLFEGAFLGLLLLASVVLIVRSLQRELELYRQQRNFLSAVTHELKSPIASARLYLESLLLGRAEGEKQERYLRHAFADLDRLHAMVEQLLESARVTSTKPELAPVPLDLVSETRAVLAELEREPETAAVAQRFTSSERVPVEVDPAALRTILRNLFSNVAKYASPEPRTEVCVSRAGSNARLQVRDFGPGLRGLDARRMFEPFVRGVDESVRTHPGVGLGLYMVSALARAHGGSARAADASEGAGLVVEIEFPLAREGARA